MRERPEAERAARCDDAMMGLWERKAAMIGLRREAGRGVFGDWERGHG